jgi:phosphatidylglycerophosphate synthase
MENDTAVAVQHVHPAARTRNRHDVAAQQRHRFRRSARVVPVPATVVVLAAVAASAGLSATGWFAGMVCSVIVTAGVARLSSRYALERLGAADWVTLARVTLAVGVGALVAESFDHRARVSMLVSLAAFALVLDAVDGWVARRTRTMSAFGARFDGEADAFLILILSVYVARSAGPWVLAIGAARYVFLAAGWALQWMDAPPPPRYWRKVVAAIQGIALTVAAADILPLGLTRVILIVALALLGESFGRDVWRLWSNRHTHPDSDLVTAAVPPRRRRPRAAAGAIALVLAVVIVWAALVAPDDPQGLKVSGFARIPMEGLVLIALGAVLPVKGRRLVAVLAGLTLTLVIALKIINYEMFKTFDRPFDPLGDTSQIGNGLETLRSVVGRTETTLIEVGAIVGVLVAAVVLVVAMLRLSRVAADHRRRALRVVAGLGAMCALSGVFGVQLASRTPIASALSAGLLVHEIDLVQNAIHDRSVFARQIDHDAFRNVPAARLLDGLRGKDVLLVFVEAYGQVAVQGRFFSPEVDKALVAGNRRLARAGFSARSGFLTSATFGGISWLAHSTLQSGLWVNSQLRYDQLMSARRMTLADAFKRAGWRTVDDVPSNDRPWPQGKSFYHWDKIYDRYQVGYRGPTFSYASMPDQYIFLALQKLELRTPHRRPLFAEVDTVSSHMPWTRIPRPVAWDQVGDGSIYNHIPMLREPDSFWWHPRRVQAAYGRSIVYALTSLTSFVQRYGRRNLVLIVLGDHQPLPIVSGQTADHVVPISIIAHDPAVLNRITSWGWTRGLRPDPHAPVWAMSAFRNRFLTAFDSARRSSSQS